MKNVLTRVLQVTLLFTVALLPCAAQAEDEALTERERMLLEKIDALEKRIERLEEGQAARQGEQAANQTPRVSEAEARSAPQETVIDEAKEANAAKAANLRAFWDTGLRLETEDGRFKLRVGGRVMTDFAWFDQARPLELAFGDEEDAAEFRRARIRLQGDVYDDLFYKLQFEFAGDDPVAFKDVYAGLKNIPYLGRLTVGHVKEPFGLEQLTSSNHVTFMERSLPDALAPGRNLGAMLSNDAFNKRLAWAAGVYKETDDWPSGDDADEDQGWAVTGRLSGLPWYREEGRKLLHLGAAYSHRNPDGANYRIRQRPEAHLANRYVNTDGIEGYRIRDAWADDVDLWGLESALVYGPFSVQGEYMLTQVETALADEVDFDGYYVQAGYFLTGEHRAYKLGSGKFDRLEPKHNFSMRGKEGGWGAWELALRYSAIDLDDDGIRGGQEHNWSLGLNWYLNPNARVMFNYIMADIDHDLYAGDLDIFQTRFQIDF